MGFLHGKRALITGILSQRSIAWGIANAMHREGAQLAFTYVDEKLKARVDEAAAAFGSNIVLPCDVTRDSDIDDLFERLGQAWDGFDILVHSIGFAPREALQGGIPRRPDARQFRHGARYLQLQPGGAGEGCASTDEGDATAPC